MLYSSEVVRAVPRFPSCVKSVQQKWNFLAEFTFHISKADELTCLSGLPTLLSSEEQSGRTHWKSYYDFPTCLLASFPRVGSKMVASHISVVLSFSGSAFYAGGSNHNMGLRSVTWDSEADPLKANLLAPE